MLTYLGYAVRGLRCLFWYVLLTSNLNEVKTRHVLRAWLSSLLLAHGLNLFDQVPLLCFAGSNTSYLRYVSPAWGIFLVFIQSMRLICEASHTNWGIGLHGGPQKENSNWCDWSRVRVRYVMKWHGLYQSVSHSVTAVVPEYWLPLGPAPLHTAVALPLGTSHSSPSCLFGPLRSFTSFYLNFTSCPFSVYYLLTSNSGSQRRGKGGKHAKRCGIFFIVLGTHSDPSQGTLPFPSHFFPLKSPLKLPSPLP